jgi:uncharacterized oxidoreductase
MDISGAFFRLDRDGCISAAHPETKDFTMKMTGNTVLITGGGSGIGLGLAQAFHALGNSVIITGRRADMLDRAAAAHPDMTAVVLDMQDAAAVRDFGTVARDRFPALNILINNAGIMQAEDLLADPMDLAVTEATVATNLLGPIRLTAALLPLLRAQTAAVVINVTSGLAFVPLALTPTYSATKAALHSYSQSLRHQLRGTPVRVVELAPPAVATDLMPRSRSNPNALPLDAFVAEAIALLAAGGDEVLVEKVRPLRRAEAAGSFDQVFAMVNPG